MNNSELFNRLDNIQRNQKELDARLNNIERQLGQLQLSIPSYEKTVDLDASTSLEDGVVSGFRRHRFFSWLLYLLNGLPLVIAKGIGISLTILTLVTGFNSLRWDISIEPYITTNPKDAFETRFVLTNLGPYSLYDVEYKCVYFKTNPARPSDIGIDDNISVDPELISHAKLSLRCENPTLSGVDAPPGVVVEVMVTYRPKFLPVYRSGYARFGMLRDSQQNAQWIPVDTSSKPSDLH